MKLMLLLLKKSVALCAFAMMATSCSSSLTYQQAMNKNENRFQNSRDLDDATFLVDAASYNALEKELNRVAIDKGYSSGVVDFARKNLKEHRELEKDLKKLAKKKKVRIPSGMKSEHRTVLEEVDETSRADFDSRFVDVLERVNEDNTDLFEDKASEAYDADIRAFAARKLDLFRSHAKEIEVVDDQLMHTHR
jgi:putative membrane protein